MWLENCQAVADDDDDGAGDDDDAKAVLPTPDEVTALSVDIGANPPTTAARIRLFNSISESVAFVDSLAAEADGEGGVDVLVTGSLYLVGNTLKVLGEDVR